MAPKIDPQYLANSIGGEVNLFIGTLRDKGAKRFGRAFGVAAFLVFASYAGIYMPPQQKSARLQAQIDKAKATAEAGAKFKDLREQLNGAYNGLPLINDREQWLSNSVRDSLAVASLNVEDFKPVREQEMNGLVFQASGVTLTLHFAELFDWLLRIESAKPMLHVQSIDINKKKELPGTVGAAADIATMIPKKRFH